MKKIIALFTVFAFMLTIAVAQEGTKTKVKTEPKKEVKSEGKVEHPKNAEKAEVSEPAKPDMQESKTGTPTKKDGTPDKRFKENKPQAKTAGPVKKDGTPDMRHKENKEAAAEKKK